MNHGFLASKLDPLLCASCKRDALSHTSLAKCESCEKRGPCNVNPRDMLLCAVCEEKNQREISVSVGTIEVKAEEVIKKAIEVDQTIRYNGDIFNAETIAIVVLKEAFLANESIPQVDRLSQFHNTLADRINHYKQVIFDCDEKKFEAISKINATVKSLRDYGAEVRKEIRDRITNDDANYQPVAPKVQPKLKKESKTALDKMIESYAETADISIDEARAFIMGKMKDKERKLAGL